MKLRSRLATAARMGARPARAGDWQFCRHTTHVRRPPDAPAPSVFEGARALQRVGAVLQVNQPQLEAGIGLDTRSGCARRNSRDEVIEHRWTQRRASCACPRRGPCQPRAEAQLPVSAHWDADVTYRIGHDGKSRDLPQSLTAPRSTKRGAMRIRCELTAIGYMLTD